MLNEYKLPVQLAQNAVLILQAAQLYAGGVIKISSKAYTCSSAGTTQGRDMNILQT